MTRRSPMLPGPFTVNAAATRNESGYPYPGRSCGREVGKKSEPWSKACRKKSAEVIVPLATVERTEQS